MSNPIDDYTPEQYTAAIDEWLQDFPPAVTFHTADYRPPKPSMQKRLTVSVHPTPETYPRSVSVPLKIDIDNSALYGQIYHARRASFLQSLAFTVINLLHAYFSRGRRR